MEALQNQKTGITCRQNDHAFLFRVTDIQHTHSFSPPVTVSGHYFLRDHFISGRFFIHLENLMT